MAKLNWSNTAVVTNITALLNDSATSFSVTDATGYPASNFKIWVDNEVMLVGSRTGTAFSSVTRGHDGTAAATHQNGAAVRHVTSAEDFQTSLLGFPVPSPLVGQDGYVVQYDHSNLEFDWVDPSTLGSGTYLPLTGGTLSGWLAITSAGETLKLSGASSSANYLSFYREAAGRTGYVGHGNPANSDLYLTADDGVLILASQRPGASNGSFYLRIDDAAGTSRDRMYVAGSGYIEFRRDDATRAFLIDAAASPDILFYKADGTTPSLVWDESDDRWEISANLDFGGTTGYAITGVSTVQSWNEALILAAVNGTANSADVYIKADDAAGTQRSRIVIDGDAHVTINDNTGAVAMTVEATRTYLAGYLEMNGNKIHTPGDPTSGYHVGDRDYNDLRYADIASEHTRYLDSEAVTAMGALGNSNPLNHSRYTDGEAAAKIASDDYYVQIAGDTMAGGLTIDAVDANVTLDGDTGSPSVKLRRTTMSGSDGVISRWENDFGFAIGSNIASTNPQLRINKDGHLYIYSGAEAGATLAQQWLAGGNIGFLKTDGATTTLLWNGGNDRWEFSTAVDFADNPMTAVGDISSYDRTLQFFANNSGAAGQDIKFIADNAGGNPRDRIFIDGDGDSYFYDNGGLERLRITTQAVSINGFLANATDPTAGTHVGDRDYNDLRYADIASEHTKYLDSEAVTAMGVKGDSNALHHDRYTDGEATAAVGTPWVALIAAEDHDHASPIATHAAITTAHHTKYTDAEAAAKIAADDLYVKVGGDTMGGNLNLGGYVLYNVLDPTAGDHVGDRDYNDARYAATVTGGYLPLSGGTMTGDIDLDTSTLYGTSVDVGDITALDGYLDTLEMLLDDGELNMNNGILYGPKDPTAGDEVGDRDYNDARYAVGDLGDYLPLAGGTMTDTINFTRVAVSGDADTYIDQTAGVDTLSIWVGGREFLRFDENGLQDKAIFDPGNVMSAVTLDMAGFYIENVGKVTANDQTLNLEAVASDASAENIALKADDATGTLRTRILIDGDGSTQFMGKDGLVKGEWHDGNNRWQVYSGIDLATNTLSSAQTISTWDTPLYLDAVSSGSSAQDIYLRADDGTGTQRNRILIDGDNDIVFYKTDGSTEWLRMNQTANVIETQGQGIDLSDAGGNGAIINPADPQFGNGIGDRDYNDARYAVGDLGDYLPLAGGSMTGEIDMSAAEILVWDGNVTDDVWSMGANTTGSIFGLYYYDDSGSANTDLLEFFAEDGSATEGDITMGSTVYGPVFGFDESAGYAYFATHLDLLNNNLTRVWSAAVNSLTSTTTVRAGNGTASAPSYSFTSDTNTGIYRVGENVLGFSVGSSLKFQIDTWFYTNVVGGAAMYSAAGTKTNPAFTFAGDTDTGMYRFAANEIGFSAGNTHVWAMNSGGSLYSTASGGRVYTGDGTVAAPAYNFYNDQDTGIYRTTTNTMGFTAGNSLKMEVDATGLQMQAATPIHFSGHASPQIYESYGVTVAGDTTHPMRVSCAFLVGITSGGSSFTQGYIYHAPPTTGNTANAVWAVASGSIYYMLRNNSSRRYKADIDYDYPLADYELKPNKHWRIDDKEWFIGLIAEDLAEQNPLFATYDDDGQVENYQDRAVLSILASKSNRADNERAELFAKTNRQEEQIAKLQAQVEQLLGAN